MAATCLRSTSSKALLKHLVRSDAAADRSAAHDAGLDAVYGSVPSTKRMSLKLGPESKVPSRSLDIHDDLLRGGSNAVIAVELA